MLAAVGFIVQERAQTPDKIRYDIAYCLRAPTVHPRFLLRWLFFSTYEGSAYHGSTYRGVTTYYCALTGELPPALQWRRRPRHRPDPAAALLVPASPVSPLAPRPLAPHPMPLAPHRPRLSPLASLAHCLAPSPLGPSPLSLRPSPPSALALPSPRPSPLADLPSQLA